MTTKTFALKTVALAALVGAAGAAQAGITVYTSLSAFNAAVGTTGTDTCAGQRLPVADGRQPGAGFGHRRRA